MVVLRVVLVLALAAFRIAAPAEPFVPRDDAVVLERLPEKGDPALADLKRMRAALAANPRDLALAIPVAQRAVSAARALGDPRFLGQAQAALAPWWIADDAPAAALLARATVRQSQHDFEGSLADLGRVLRSDPEAAQARLSRATALAVQGRYAESLDDCIRLGAHVSRLVATGCAAVPQSLSGDAQSAYRSLVRALEGSADAPPIREWALTLAAEIAARRGDFAAAERLFQAALALDRRDAYLQGAYADFLLERERAADVIALLRDDTKNDALLLRLVLAEQRLPAERAAFVVHRSDLAARFEAARRRGDALHRREEARFRLAIEGDAAGAVALARDNWRVQREPADLRILIDAARAARDPQALRTAKDWIAANRLEDVAVAAAMR
jgi:hypothetical protein